MALIKYHELQRRIQLEGMRDTVQHIGQALIDGHLNAGDFNLRELAEATIVTNDGSPCGREWVASLNPQRGGGLVLLEAEDAIDSTAFSNITGQIVYSKTMEGYNQAGFVSDQLVTTIPSALEYEIMPGMGGLQDNEGTIHEGKEYPHANVQEDWVETPRTTKRGLIVSLTKEAVFFNRTGLLLQSANQTGEVLRRRKEKAILGLVMGLTNSYKWQGTTYNTYQTASPWINTKASNGITVTSGWQQVDASEQLFTDLLDPHTGEPIVVEPNAILHMPARNHHWARVTSATELRSNAGSETLISGNVVQNYQRISSRFAYRELIGAGETAAYAADYWFHGNFKKAFAWMENWPVTTVQAPANSEPEFTQDIVMRFKSSERGVQAVLDPRYVVFNYEAKTL